MIKINNLTKIYGKGNKAVTALKNLNWEIDEGMFGLLGPNGAGKTTLMRILAGIVNPTDGDVLVEGQSIRSKRGKHFVKNMLGYLPQELGLYPDLTGRQFVDYLAMLKGAKDGKARAAKVSQVLEMVSLTSEADRKIKAYSGGMKRRVGIAQALVNDPRILIVDEPTSGLDPEERIRFRNLLVDLAQDRIVLLSTHIVADIGQTCRSMSVLNHGQSSFQGSPMDLTRRAEGHVWTIRSVDGAKPDGGLTVVSMVHMPDAVHYRVVGESVNGYADAQPEAPSLEDGYMWLMKQKNN